MATAPTIISNGGGDTARVVVPENTLAITTVVATDPDPGTNIAYSIIGGPDQSRLVINSATGQLTFFDPIYTNFESPADSGNDNTYIVQVRASDGVLFDTQTITVSLSDVNEPPRFSGGSFAGSGSLVSFPVPENTTAIGRFSATDPDANTIITYSKIGGPDETFFSLNSATGLLTFFTPRDFENPADSDHNNSYILQVRASDGQLTADQTVIINIDDVNEQPFIISNGGVSSAAISVAENSTFVTQVAAIDPEGQPLTYRIEGGSSVFKIDTFTGILSFIVPPDYDAPGAAHFFSLFVSAFDGTRSSASQSIQIALTNVPDNEIDPGAFTDLGGDGRSDVFLHNQDGRVAIWEMNGAGVKTAQIIGAVGTEWHVESTGDFTGDGIGDVVWRAANGTVMAWQMNGPQIGQASIVGGVGNEWHIQGTGDLDGDGGADLVWRDDAGTLMLWKMNGTQIQSVQFFGAVGHEWHVEGIADFGGDNRDDILWRRDDGAVLLFQMNGTQIQAANVVGAIGIDWHFEGTPDLNGDGRADILWRNDNGGLITWLMNGAQMLSGQSIGARGTDWHIQGTGDFGGDGKDDILWRNDNGSVDLWQMNGAQVANASFITGLGLDWTLGVHHYDFV
jgi:Cadherin domain/FG-GAP-like repeat